MAGRKLFEKASINIRKEELRWEKQPEAAKEGIDCLRAGQRKTAKKRRVGTFFPGKKGTRRGGDHGEEAGVVWGGSKKVNKRGEQG